MDHKAVYVVTAEWDADLKRWSAMSEDIPGLFLEADTMEQIVECIDDMALELIEANLDTAVQDVPVFLQANYATRVSSSAGHA